jgi:glycosyltransferase involved in cell wall biosynthesis
VRVIPYGVDTKQFHPALRLALRAEARSHWRFRENEFVILLIGNDWGTKGLDTLLEAVAPLSDLPFRLLVVGSDEPGAFRGRAIQLGIQGRCDWEPPRREVLDFYAAADVYVSPSREDSFGLPVAEAMACGLPVITSVLAGVSDYIQDGVDGFVLSDPRDAQVLAQLLRRLYADAALRHKIEEAAHKKASEWTWDKHAEGAWELIQGAAAKKSGSKAPRELP